MSNAYASVPILRNDDLNPVSLAQLKKQCPAVFAKAAHPDVTQRYGFIDSAQVVETIMDEGLVPVEARNYSRRNGDLLQWTKHMIKFRPAGNVKKLIQVGDVVPQIILIGSHDRSSAFQMYGGLFRLVCSNGMVVSAGRHVNPVKLRHTSNVVAGVQEAIKAVAKQHSKVFAHVEEMQKIKMSQAKQLEFAKAALDLRVTKGMIQPEAILEARREADKGDDVWRVYNRVQENMLKGNVPGITATGRQTRTMGITQINYDMQVNSALWQLALDATL